MSDPDKDFEPEISLLRERRPTLPAVDLDHVKARVRGKSKRARRGGWQAFASTRAAVVATLAAGVLMSTGGTALAVSGFDLGGSAASTAQYGGSGGGGGQGAVGGQTGQGDPGPSERVSPAELIEQEPVSTAGQLPFTGFLAIPILLIGLALVAAGLLGRRTAARSSGAPRS